MTVWEDLTTPSPYHDGVRIIDLLIPLLLMLLCLPLGEGWALLGFPLAGIGFYLSRKFIPDHEDSP